MSISLREAVIILGVVPVWSEEVLALIKQKFPKLQITQCNDKAVLRALVEKNDVAMIICQGETDADLNESFQFIKSVNEYLERGTTVFGIYTNRISNPNLQVFEKRKLLRRFSPWSTTRAIPLHLESALLDLRRAFTRLQKTQRQGENPEPLPSQAAVVEPIETIAVVDDKVEEEATPEKLPVRVDSTFDDIVLVSQKEEDLQFCTAVAKKLSCNFHLFTQVSKDLQKMLGHYPDAVVFWDVEFESANLIPLLQQSAKKHHIFVISDQPALRHPALSSLIRERSIHNLTRKTDLSSRLMYSHLVENALIECPLSLNRFFTYGSRRNIQLTSSDHRGPALVAMRKFLSDEGMSPRLGNLVDQACDELLLNAIYHAPVDKKGIHYQESKDKSFAYPFRKAEEVTISLMSNDHYFGICVIDSFGSLQLNQALSYLINEQKSSSPHLGLFKILDSGFSLLLNVIPGQLTEAMIFFPKAASHKEFKSGFRFFSVRSGKATLPY